ncbi:MAG: CIA30 family protein [Bacteroidia bacterium]
MKIGLTLICIAMLGTGVAEFKMDFGQEMIGAGWFTILDGVMGGRSSGQVAYNDESMVFTGAISLENNGGFSSMRSPVQEYDFSQFDTVKIRVRGDGRTYGFMLERQTGYRSPYFRYNFKTEADTWTEIDLPIAAFNGYIYGRKVIEGLDKESLQSIDRMGVILADKNPGDFKLEIDYITLK